jgi:hypothetical protein
VLRGNVLQDPAEALTPSALRTNPSFLEGDFSYKRHWWVFRQGLICRVYEGCALSVSIRSAEQPANHKLRLRLAPPIKVRACTFTDSQFEPGCGPYGSGFGMGLDKGFAWCGRNEEANETPLEILTAFCFSFCAGLPTANSGSDSRK